MVLERKNKMKKKSNRLEIRIGVLENLSKLRVCLIRGKWREEHVSEYF
jgi:hypothetical protein